MKIRARRAPGVASILTVARSQKPSSTFQGQEMFLLGLGHIHCLSHATWAFPSSIKIRSGPSPHHSLSTLIKKKNPPASGPLFSVNSVSRKTDHYRSFFRNYNSQRALRYVARFAFRRFECCSVFFIATDSNTDFQNDAFW